MVLTKVLTPRSAARALNWNILAIIAGSVGLGAIVVNSGLADDISHAILHLSNASTAAVVLAIAVGTTVLTNVVTNAAAAAILTPVGLSVAMTSGLNPVLVLALIGTCISFTFLNPFTGMTYVHRACAEERPAEQHQHLADNAAVFFETLQGQDGVGADTPLVAGMSACER